MFKIPNTPSRTTSTSNAAIVDVCENIFIHLYYYYYYTITITVLLLLLLLYIAIIIIFFCTHDVADKTGGQIQLFDSKSMVLFFIID
jgi:hypothetical protein